MNETVLFGQGRQYTEIPRKKWEEHLSQAPGRDDPRHAFMTAQHHQVRNFIVRELPRLGQPMPPAFIAQNLGLPLEHLVLYPELIYRMFIAGQLAEEAVLKLVMRCYYPDTFERLIQDHGFVILNRWGGYAGEAYGQGPELVIQFCEQEGVIS